MSEVLPSRKEMLHRWKLEEVERQLRERNPTHVTLRFFYRAPDPQLDESIAAAARSFRYPSGEMYALLSEIDHVVDWTDEVTLNFNLDGTLQGLEIGPNKTEES